MSWPATILSVASTILSLVLLPVRLLFSALLVLLAPAIYLGRYVLAAALLPVKLFAKFETLYIYLGVAAIVGLVTGVILHFFSTLLVSLFNLTPAAQEPRRTAASVRAEREQKKLEAAWEFSTAKQEPESWRDEVASRRNQAQWLDMDRGRRREEPGLLGQTILEEEDSEDEF
ncbi:hypothetical protein GLAREA_07038 [Glarea lozoyensis ATCC 20868]|uniref:Uncharacterized protein n=1 Tax=Glarea lozoyensis (strain ATCC 20868 / MF5171) TaxID=1116229 RepID=S3D8E2_GLAL2|nr:uncharacterized protein GLAREA_07038 [Glarea lozoyensis ATCC 20868]EPE34025.1 hypothetical protein GLAREA_07038 [Glarea lozoyensis ATCC 20868]